MRIWIYQMTTASRSEALNQDLLAVLTEVRLCRLHHNLKCSQLIPAEIRFSSAKTINHTIKTPVRIGVLAGVKIRATEAAQTPQVNYPAFGSRDQGRSRGDLSQL